MLGTPTIAPTTSGPLTPNTSTIAGSDASSNATSLMVHVISVIMSNHRHNRFDEYVAIATDEDDVDIDSCRVRCFACGGGRGIGRRRRRRRSWPCHPRQERRGEQDQVRMPQEDGRRGDRGRSHAPPSSGTGPVPPLSGIASTVFDDHMTPYVALEERSMANQLRAAASDNTVDARGEQPSSSCRRTSLYT